MILTPVDATDQPTAQAKSRAFPDPIAPYKRKGSDESVDSAGCVAVELQALVFHCFFSGRSLRVRSRHARCRRSGVLCEGSLGRPSIATGQCAIVEVHTIASPFLRSAAENGVNIASTSGIDRRTKLGIQTLPRKSSNQFISAAHFNCGIAAEEPLSKVVALCTSCDFSVQGGWFCV
jgi:hypothetical protein